MISLLGVWEMVLSMAANPDAQSDIIWQSSTPEEQSLDSRELVRVMSKVRELHIELHSLILIRNGRLIARALEEHREQPW